MALRKLSAVAFAAALGSLVSAQNLAPLLPEETFFALGMQDWRSTSEQFQDFSDEFTRLGVADALGALAVSEGEDGSSNSGLVAEDMETLETLGSADVLGQEAWLAVSATTSSPLPALTLVTQVTPEGAERVQALIDGAEPAGQRQELEESGIPFVQLDIENDSPIQTFAYSLNDDLLAISTNPDALRGVLRRAAGADEPNFVSAQGYTDTLGALEAGSFYGFIDYARIAEVAAPYAQNMGYDQLVTRLSEAFTTAGSVGSVLTVTEDGLSSESFQALNPQGGDEALYELLSTSAPATRDVGMPEGALTFSASTFDVGGWYDYLNSLALAVPELGGDLDSLLLSFTGLSLRESLISWAGNQVVNVTTGFAAPTEAGVPSENMLGEQVFMLQANNEAAAQRGLDGLFTSLNQTVSSLTAPEGNAQDNQGETETVEGAQVTRYDLAPGASVFYAVNQGYALIGTSEDAITRTLAAQGQSAPQELFSDVPDDAYAYTHSDDQATYQNLAAQMGSTIQTAAGMGGGENLDFEAVERSSKAVEDFLTFVATRLQTTTSYSETSADGIRSYAESQISWQE